MNMTNKEFRALERNDIGDVIDLYGVFYTLTPTQVEKLSEDDFTRYDEYQEEARVLFNQAKEEFGF